MLQELLYLGPDQEAEETIISFYVLNLYRAIPTTFRVQIEQ
jgi:hypothetical protein